MTRLRRALVLAFCALFSLPLGAAALEFHANFKEYALAQYLESDDATLSWRETLVLETDSASEGHRRFHPFDRPAAGPARIRELISGHLASGTASPLPSHVFSEFSERFLARRVSRHFDFFHEIQNPHADSHASRARMFRHGRRAWARLARFRARTSGPPPIPEPTTAVLMGIGLIGLAVAGRRDDA